MKVYISCHHRDPANALSAELTAAGHEVVSTWHAATCPRPAADDRSKWAESAKRNVAAVLGADALVVVACPDHVARVRCVPGGKFVEAGVALSGGRRVFTVGGVENGMLFHPHVEHVDDAAELVAALGGAK